jgi:hypothetical protein
MGFIFKFIVLPLSVLVALLTVLSSLNDEAEEYTYQADGADMLTTLKIDITEFNNCYDEYDARVKGVDDKEKLSRADLSELVERGFPLCIMGTYKVGLNLTEVAIEARYIDIPGSIPFGLTKQALLSDDTAKMDRCSDVVKALIQICPGTLAPFAKRIEEKAR